MTYASRTRRLRRLDRHWPAAATVNDDSDDEADMQRPPTASEDDHRHHTPRSARTDCRPYRHWSIVAVVSIGGVRKLTILVRRQTEKSATYDDAKNSGEFKEPSCHDHF